MEYRDFTQEAKIYFERSYSINGCSYLVIFGHHVNGGFLCIPNHNISLEISDVDMCNTAKSLADAGLDKSAASAIFSEIEKFISENLCDIQEANNISQQAIFSRLREAGLVYRIDTMKAFMPFLDYEKDAYIGESLRHHVEGALQGITKDI